MKTERKTSTGHILMALALLAAFLSFPSTAMAYENVVDWSFQEVVSADNATNASVRVNQRYANHQITAWTSCVRNPLGVCNGTSLPAAGVVTVYGRDMLGYTDAGPGTSPDYPFSGTIDLTDPTFKTITAHLTELLFSLSTEVEGNRTVTYRVHSWNP